MALALPHPPVLVEEVGGRDTARVDRTRRALAEVGLMVSGRNPEVLAVVGPHAPVGRRSFGLYVGPVLKGSFGAFGAPQARLEVRAAEDAAARVRQEAEARGLETFEIRSRLDHSILVPLWFLMGPGASARPTEARVLAGGVSWGPLEEQARYGECLARALEGWRAVLVASGDLSHRLTPDAPYGYTPRGREFDEFVLACFTEGQLSRLLRVEPGLEEEAGACGLRSFCILAGALGDGVRGRVLSYEGPFGVGYPVVAFELAVD